MSWIEILLIVAGISLDIFAAMECQGSLVQKVDKKHLAIICTIISVWQLIALFVGHFLSRLLYKQVDTQQEVFIGYIIAITIFFCLGIRLIVKAVTSKGVFERRENNLGIKRFVRMVAATSFYTISAGVAFGLFETDFLLLLAFIIVLSILFVVAGMYTGYHFGFEHQTKAYVAGTVLLWIAGIDMIVRLMNNAL